MFSLKHNSFLTLLFSDQFFTRAGERSMDVWLAELTVDTLYHIVKDASDILKCRFNCII